MQVREVGGLCVMIDKTQYAPWGVQFFTTFCTFHVGLC